MRAVNEHLYRRGKRGTFYVRRRIPTGLRDLYPRNKREVVVSLRTSDERLARARLHEEMARLEAEFQGRALQLRQRWNPPQRQRITSLTPALLDDLANSWVRSVLHSDEQARRHGLSDEDFDELTGRLAEQRAEFHRLLARGAVDSVIPAFRTVLHLNGLDAKLSAEEERAGAFRFLQAVTQSIDLRARRHEGEVVGPDVVPAPASPDAGWAPLFDTWHNYVEDRPRPTSIACQDSLDPT